MLIRAANTVICFKTLTRAVQCSTEGRRSQRLPTRPSGNDVTGFNFIAKLLIFYNLNHFILFRSEKSQNFTIVFLDAAQTWHSKSLELKLYDSCQPFDTFSCNSFLFFIRYIYNRYYNNYDNVTFIFVFVKNLTLYIIDIIILYIMNIMIMWL